MLSRRCCVTPRLLRRLLPAAAVSVALTVLYLTYRLGQLHGLAAAPAARQQPPDARLACAAPGGDARSDEVSHASPAAARLDAKVLLFVESPYSAAAKELGSILTANGFRYKAVSSASLPSFTAGDRGRFATLLFETYATYLALDAWSRQIVDKYCQEYDVGIAAFMPSQEGALHGAELTGTGLRVHANIQLQDAQLSPDSSVLRIAKPGETLLGPLPGEVHTVFAHNHSSYRAVVTAAPRQPLLFGNRTSLTLVLQDCGYHDSIRRVLFGSPLSLWLSRLVLLDALSYLSHGLLARDLERHILVDVDDIFVGKSGTRMKPEDVTAMIESQQRIRKMVPGFTFNLGFCGKMLHTGNDEENAGDDALIAAAGQFWWFPHIWSHKKPHLFANLSSLAHQMTLNKEFAETHRIPVTQQYAVAPHHSGVYPVHSDLYDAWRQVWGVRQTSTEEYPHLYPAGQRRGFVYSGIRVLPRQTCGLFTHTVWIDKYPGGRQALDDKILGGEVFQTILFNPISIFMTHLSNYGNDRLALYTFESVVRFLGCWTRLRLSTEPPGRLADRYFDRYPDQRDPVWGNPCSDRRHLSLWRPAGEPSVCRRWPRLLVLGPQKTGSTALHGFLARHPALRPSLPSPQTFEEPQFFSGPAYLRGLDWYLSLFPPTANESVLPFEKSATYFDAPAAPRRVHALLPDVKLVAILLSPVARAYSWYQHQRAHGVPAALQYSFYDVITAGNRSERGLRQLRNRCLEPGRYAVHLEAWLRQFAASQLHLVDGEVLRSDPVSELHRLQTFLQLSPVVDFGRLVKYDPQKGFYCPVDPSTGRTKCLGQGKGRHYPPMEPEAKQYLKRFYRPHNVRLHQLLKRTGKPVPAWLVTELS